MPEEKNGKQIPPPYLPYRTLKTYLESLKGPGIPGRIDRSVLRNRSGSEQTMLMSALSYLGLILPDGTPTQDMQDLVRADGATREKLLTGILQNRYPFLFTDMIDITRATPSQVNAAFSDAGVSGDTVRKAVAFFVAAAHDAKVPVSSFLKVRAPRGAARRRRATSEPPSIEPTSSGEPMRVGNPYEVLIGILDPEGMDDKEQEAVWTLIRYLKKQGG